MNDFEIAYLIFGTFVIISGVTMIVTYTATNPWWKDHLGRMMIAYAATELAMSSLLLITVEFHTGPHWFRIAWFCLQTILGLCFCYQTRLIVNIHRQRRREREEAPQ